MRLPQIPYPNYRSSVVKNKVQTMDFRGLNLSAAAGEGEMSDSKGISTADYPWLTQRPQRAPISGYDEPTDIYEWDGHLVVTDNGVLYYDGDALCNVSDGKKQYAVVNTKLIVWPDALVIDLTTAKVTNMAAAVTNHGNATLTSNAIELVPRTEYSSREYNVTASGVDHKWPWGWVYDSVSWDGESWTLTGGALVNFFTGNVDGKYFVPTASRSQVTDEYTIGPTRLRWSDYDDTPPDYPEPAPGNDIGFYCEINFVEFSVSETLIVFKYRNTAYYAPSENNADLTEMFEAGEFVDVEGTFLGLADGEHMTLSAVESDKLTFGETFIVPVWYLEVEEDITTGHTGMIVKWTDNGTTYRISIGNYQTSYTFREGNYLLYRTTSGGQEVIEWNPVRKAIEQTISVNAPSTGSGTSLYTATLFDGTMTEEFTVSRNVPKLDYICAHENRLWGVSNRVTNKVWNTDTETWDTFTSRVIYASELGQPMRFWTFNGVDTDSYQVAVGSEDDFTAICSFGGGVCCWKENRLHKILGSYPSEYYMAEYQFAGVTDAASMAVINETLFYKGRAGIYAWNGGVPSLVSAQLGNGPYTDAVGGTDGSKYYVSMRDTDDRFFVYDRGLWVKDDDIRVDAMCFYNGSMHFLIDGDIYAGGTETVTWMAEFAPMTEGTLDRKGYTRINIRLDMYAGSSIKVETKQDRRAWETVWQQNADDSVTLNVPIRIGRCDRFQIRLSGQGKVTVQAMRRELIGGHER